MKDSLRLRYPTANLDVYLGELGCSRRRRGVHDLGPPPAAVTCDNPSGIRHCGCVRVSANRELLPQQERHNFW